MMKKKDVAEKTDDVNEREKFGFEIDEECDTPRGNIAKHCGCKSLIECRKTNHAFPQKTEAISHMQLTSEQQQKVVGNCKNSSNIPKTGTKKWTIY